MDIRTLVSAAIIVLLAGGCGSTADAPGTPNLVPLHRPAGLKSIAQTMYVTNIGSESYSQLVGYSLIDQQLVYSTDDPSLKEPEGLAADSRGAIYVANTYGYDILKFIPPKERPAQRIDDKGYRPTSVGIDRRGNIWVANWCTSTPSCGQGNVREYSSGGTKLHTITCANLYRPLNLGVDKKGNVVVDGSSFGSGYASDEIKAGTTKCTPLPALQYVDSGGVQFLQNGDVGVIGAYYGLPEVYTYAKPDFSKLVASSPLDGIAGAWNYAFEPAVPQLFWVTDEGDTAVVEFRYPQGGYPIGSITLSFPSGIVITRTKKAS